MYKSRVVFDGAVAVKHIGHRDNSVVSHSDVETEYRTRLAMGSQLAGREIRLHLSPPVGERRGRLLPDLALRQRREEYAEADNMPPPAPCVDHKQ